MAKNLNVNLNVTADTGQAAAALKNLQATLQTLVTSTNNLTIGGQLKSGITDATAAVGQLQAALKEATNVNTGNLNLTQFTQSMKASGMSLEKYQAALSQMGPAGKQAFAQLASSIATAEVPIRRSNALLQEMGTTIKNAARWQISSSIIHGFMGAVQKAYGYAQDLNKSLNNIQIVTGLSDDKMAKFAENANRAAKQLSTTTTSYTDAALIYYQQGIRDDQQIAERVEATIKLANVSGQSAQKVSDQMTAIWNNFDNGTHSLEYYADVITALGAATASSSEEIATGLEKFAAIADTVGLSYENASAALATITATTRQSADTVGTGLRTLFSRLQSLSLGDTLEDGVNLTKYTKALETVGVSALDASGNLRSMDDVLDDLGSKWQTLSDAQKTALAQTVGGVRQYTTLIALMDNFDFYKENQQVALNSEGTVQQQADIYAQSWEAASKRVRASAESIYADLLDDKFFVGLTNGFASFLNIIDSIIDGLGGVKGVLLGIGTLLTTTFAGRTTQVLTNFANDIMMMFPKGQKAVQDQRTLASNLLTSTVGDMYKSPEGNAAVTESYRIQGQLQESYIANAAKMSAAQQQVAQQILAQNAALRQGVELTAQELDNTNQTVNSRKAAARGAMNSVNKDYAANARQVSALQAMGQDAGKASAYLQKLDFSKITNAGDLQKVQAQMQALGISIKSFSAYGSAAARSFYEFKAALASGDIDKASTAFDNLINAMERGTTHADSFINKIVQMAADAGASDTQLENLRNALTDVFTGAQQTGEGIVQLNTQVSQVGEHAQQATVTFEQLATKVQSTLGNIVTFAGGLSSFVMGLNMVKSAIQTLNNEDLTIGERLTGALLPAIMAVSMLSSSISTLMGTEAAEIAINTIGMTQHFASAAAAEIHALAEFGLAGALDLVKAKILELYAACPPLLVVFALLAAAIGVIVGLVAGISRIADLIVTPAEAMASLQAATEQAKTAAEDARNAYNDLVNGFENHNTLLDTLDQMTVGTLEFQNALLQANAAAMDLIDTYGITEGVSIGDKGQILISDEARRKAESQAYQEMQDAETQYRIAQAQENYMQVQQDWQKIASARNMAGFDVVSGEFEDLTPEQLESRLANNQELVDLLKDYDISIKQVANGATFDDFLIASGAAYKNRNALTNIALQDGSISGLESVLIDQQATDTDLWRKIYNQSTNIDMSRYGGTGTRNIETATKNQLKDIYKTIFSEDELTEFLDEHSDLKGDELKTALRSAIRNKVAQDIATAEFNSAQETLKDSQVGKFGEEFKSQKSGQALEQFAKLQAQGFQTETEKLFADQLAQQMQQSMDSYINLANDLGIENKQEATRLTDAMKNMSFEDMDRIVDIGKNFKNTFGAESANKIFDELSEAAAKGNTRVMQAAQNLNLSGDIIKDLAATRKAFKGLEDDIDLENLLSTMKQEAGGKKGIFEELYNSEDFADNLKTLQKQFKKTGKIGAKAILDMAEESEYLQEMLDESDITAQGLADTLEALELGDVGIEDLSDQLIEAFSAAGELENTLAEVFSYIDNFQQERSTQDIGKFYKGLSDSVQGAWEAGQIMDPQALQAWGEMFGPESLANYRKFMAEVTNDNNLTPEQISDKINGKFADEVAAMRSIQKYGDLSGMFEYYDKKGVVEGGTEMFSFNKETGQVVTAGGEKSADYYKQQGWDSESGFIQGLIDNYGVTEQMAKSMAAEYASTNAFLNQMWHETAAQNGIEKLIGTTTQEESVTHPGRTETVGHVAGDGVTTAKELEAFYNQYQDVLKNAEGESYKDFSAFLEDMQGRAAETGQAIVDLGKDFKYSEANLDTLKKTMDNSEGLSFDEYMKKVTGTTEASERSFDSLEKAFTRLGYTASEAHKLIDQQIQEQAEKSGTSYSEAFKSQFVQATEAGKAQWERFQQYLNDNHINPEEFTSEDWANFLNTDEAESQLQHTAEVMANAIAEAFSNLKIQLADDGTITIEVETSEVNDETVEEYTPDPVEVPVVVGNVDSSEVQTELETRYNGRPVQPQAGYSNEQLSWLTNYAQWSAAENGGTPQLLSRANWDAFSAYATGAGLGEAPAWSTGILGLGSDGVKNWMPDGSAGIANAGFLQDLANIAGPLDSIVTNTADTATAVEAGNDNDDGGTVQRREGEGTTSAKTAQQTYTADQIAFGQAIKQAGIDTRSDTYGADLGKLVTQISSGLSDLPQNVQDAIIKGVENNTDVATAQGAQQAAEKAGITSVDEAVDVTANVVEFDVEADVPPVETTAKIIDVQQDEEGNLTMNIEANTADVEAVKAEIEAMGGEVVETQVDGDTTQLTAKIDAENAKDLIEYVNGDVTALRGAIMSCNGTTIMVQVDIDPASLAAAQEKINSLGSGGGDGGASGYNNVGGYFAGGKHSNGQYRGLATVGELGPELMIHRGQPYLVGVNGRTTAYVEPDDQIYTAAETKRIMDTNPTLEDIPGFSVGYNRISWGSSASKAGGGSGGKSKSSSKDFDPERYHYISQQIKNINQFLERMNKLKDHAYGSHRVRAIEKEIDATKKLYEANELLLQEEREYLEQDRSAIAGLGVEFDANGEIKNWDALQEKYARAAAESEDEATRDAAKKNWNLIKKYQETIDKIHETEEELDDLRWSLSDLINEELEAKVEIRIDMDDRELELLDYYLDKIQDNIYKTADAFNIVNGKLNIYNDQIATYKNVMNDLLKNATNAQGDSLKDILGHELTMDEWLRMTPQQRDALDIDGDLGKKLEEYSANVLEVMQNIQDLKLYAVEALGKAFDELNGKVQDSMDIFNHYGNLLSSLRDISDLQGMTMNKDMQKAIDAMNQSMIANTENNIKAQQEYYTELTANAEALREQIERTADWQVKEALEEQLANIEELMRNAEENILSLWQDGLSKAQEMFQSAIDNALKEYEKAIAGVYSNVDNLKEAYERQSTLNDQYVDDYEKLYRLSKLQRQINNDLDKAAVNGNRRRKDTLAILAEVEDYQTNGQQMSEYDLQLLEKRYEYEKALADLEDLRNAKQTVRLQRDRSGNWGYVYTAVDSDDLAKQEQAVEDKLHEWQQFEMESIEQFSSQLFDLQTEYGQQLADIMNATWDSDEDRDAAIARLDEWYQERLSYLNKYLDSAFIDANSTIERAKERYQTEEFEIVDSFSKTTLGMINNTVGTTQELIANLQKAMDDMKTAAQTALQEYSETIIKFNELVEQSNQLFAEYANGQASSITELSKEQLDIVGGNIDKMAETLRTGNNAMLDSVEKFNRDYYNKFYGPNGIISVNEAFLNQLQTALDYLNRIDYAVDKQQKVNEETGIITDFDNTRTTAQSVTGFASGGYTGSWGTEGRLALLHQKEQIFNADDTANLLDAANILRTLDLQAGLLAHGIGDIFTPFVKDFGQTIEQDIHITAEFPNATNHSEIEEAFNNLANRATQYANRKVG